MALAYPNVTDMAPRSVNDRELETLNFLKTLSRDLTVYHNVHWSRSEPGYTVFGELDFIITNESGKILVIEQKNGTLDFSSTGLIKRYGTYEKNVVMQVQRSIENLRHKLAPTLTRAANVGRLTIDYLIYCPDFYLQNANAAGLDTSRVIDAHRVSQLPKIIEQIMTSPDPQGSDARGRLINNFFRQSYQLVPDVHRMSKHGEAYFKRLSGELIDVVNNLKLKPNRLKVVATAGGGKSQLAAIRYTQAIAQGGRPLYLCYNRPLMDQIKSALPDGGTVATWFGFCDHFMSQMGQAIDFSLMGKEPKFWDNVQENMMAFFPLPESDCFTHAIIDEGQDFQPMWWLMIQEFLVEDAPVLWIEDPAQDVRNLDSTVDDFPATYYSDKNYRTPQHIAQYILRTLPFSFEACNPVEGMPVEEITLHSSDQQATWVANVVRSLLKAGHKPEDIGILSGKGLSKAPLYQHEKIAGLTLKKYTHRYSSQGEQVYTDGQLLMDSVRRFKGKQKPVIILIDIKASDLQNDHGLQKIMFVGCTRATSQLFVGFDV